MRQELESAGPDPSRQVVIHEAERAARIMKTSSKTSPEDLAEPYVDGVQDDSVHPVTGEQSAEESGLLIIEFSKLDPEMRRGIVGELAPEETPEEREARLERCRIATTEYDAEFGPLTPEDKAWADAVLDRLDIDADTCQERRGRVGRRGDSTPRR